MTVLFLVFLSYFEGSIVISKLMLEFDKFLLFDNLWKYFHEPIVLKFYIAESQFNIPVTNKVWLGIDRMV